MRLLVAVDLDDHPDELVDRALSWAARLDAAVDLVFVDEHAFDPAIVRDPSLQHVVTREWERIGEARRARLEALLERVPELKRGEAMVRTGRAGDAIAAAAEGHDAVLIGTHGRRGLPRLLLGSVAERVCRAAPVPVFVIRSGATP